MDIDLKQYKAKLSGMPNLLNLHIDGKNIYYSLSEEIYIDEKNNRCYVEYVGGIPEDLPYDFRVSTVLQ